MFNALILVIFLYLIILQGLVYGQLSVDSGLSLPVQKGLFHFFRSNFRLRTEYTEVPLLYHLLGDIDCLGTVPVFNYDPCVRLHFFLPQAYSSNLILLRTKTKDKINFLDSNLRKQKFRASELPKTASCCSKCRNVLVRFAFTCFGWITRRLGGIFFGIQ